MTSILSDTKKTLGLEDDYTPFDSELVLHINSALSDLNQLGVGPEAGFEITGKDEGWELFLENDPRLNSVKSYLYLRCRLLFDPPSNSAVLMSIEKMLERAEWRINHAREEIAHPPVVETPVLSPDLFGDLP